VIEAALIGEEDAAFTGGSYVIVQKYLHDLHRPGRLDRLFESHRQRGAPLPSGEFDISSAHL
jgi:deferrochelatase/peroxidase EfeB